jgi:hypothetical protein
MHPPHLLARRGPLLILIPVLNRPDRVEPALASITAATQFEHRALFICDPDDTREQNAVRRAGGDMLICGGSYAHKINEGIAASPEPLLFLAADDLHFHPGWLAPALAQLTRRVGVVGTNDLGNPRVLRGRHATHCLVARWYAEQGAVDAPGRLLHEGYRHNFVDNELVETARSRGAWAFAQNSIVEHQHPHWGKAEMDATYELGQSRWDEDRETYMARRPLWMR